jgi:hypothetical protein
MGDYEPNYDNSWGNVGCGAEAGAGVIGLILLFLFLRLAGVL